MSAFTIINDITLEIRKRIFASLNSAPGVTLNFTNEATNIVFTPPQETPDNGARLSLYLYHIGVNGAMRNRRLLSRQHHSGELLLPPLPLELRYIATPMDEEENNQLIIGRLLQFIYDYSTLDSIDDEPVENALSGTPRLRITPDLMNVEQLSQLWNAFSQPFRLSIAFQVDVVTVDSARAPIVAPRIVDVLAVSGVKEGA